MRLRPITPEIADEAKALHAAGASYRKIAERLGIARGTVPRLIREPSANWAFHRPRKKPPDDGRPLCPIAEPRRPELSPAMQAAILESRAEGATLDQIAAESGVDLRMVAAVCGVRLTVRQAARHGPTLESDQDSRRRRIRLIGLLANQQIARLWSGLDAGKITQSEFARQRAACREWEARRRYAEGLA